jgi:hypothetical protein
MPDKRDMHQAKSHRNSKSAKQQAAGGAQQRPNESQMPGGAAVGTTAPAFESGERSDADTRGNNSGPDNRGKRNKSGR